MYFQDIGRAIRRARQSRGLSQAALAAAAGISRGTINQLEAGVFPDLGVKKLLAILKVLELDISIIEKLDKRTDYLDLACISANVSYRGRLTPDELAHALLTGKVPPGKGPQLRVVFDEIPSRVFRGVVERVAGWGDPDKTLENVRRIGESIGASRVLVA
jgi:transcriptional regulator with XRE-family HTH domain